MFIKRFGAEECHAKIMLKTIEPSSETMLKWPRKPNGI